MARKISADPLSEPTTSPLSTWARGCAGARAATATNTAIARTRHSRRMIAPVTMPCAMIPIASGGSRAANEGRGVASGHQAAADGDLGPRGVGGGVRGQVERRFGDLLRRAQALGR